MIISLEAEAAHFVDAGDVNTVRRIADPYVILALEIMTVHKWPPWYILMLSHPLIVSIVHLKRPAGNR